MAFLTIQLKIRSIAFCCRRCDWCCHTPFFVRGFKLPRMTQVKLVRVINNGPRADGITFTHHSSSSLWLPHIILHPLLILPRLHGMCLSGAHNNVPTQHVSHCPLRPAAFNALSADLILTALRIHPLHFAPWSYAVPCDKRLMISTTASYPISSRSPLAPGPVPRSLSG